QACSLVAFRLRIAGAGVLIVDLRIIPGDDEVKTGNDPEHSLASVPAGYIGIRRCIDEQTPALAVGPVEPPVEAVVTGTDPRDVSAAADGPLARQHRRFLARGQRRVGGKRAGEGHLQKVRTDDLLVVPFAAAQDEQTETRQIADRQRQSAGTVLRPEGVEGVFVLELKDIRQPRLQHLRALLLEDLLSQQIVIKSEGVVVVGVGLARGFAQTETGSLGGEVPPGNGRVLAVVQGLQAWLEVGNRVVYPLELALLDGQQEQRRQYRLERGGDVTRFGLIAPGENHVAVP